MDFEKLVWLEVPYASWPAKHNGLACKPSISDCHSSCYHCTGHSWCLVPLPLPRVWFLPGQRLWPSTPRLHHKARWPTLPGIKRADMGAPENMEVVTLNNCSILHTNSCKPAFVPPCILHGTFHIPLSPTPSKQILILYMQAHVYFVFYFFDFWGKDSGCCKNSRVLFLFTQFSQWWHLM